MICVRVGESFATRQDLSSVKEKGGKGKTASIPMVASKTLIQNFDVLNSTGSMILDELCSKLTFDSRQCTHRGHQTKCMMIIIPKGKDRPYYCQSALRVWTIITQIMSRAIWQDSSRRLRSFFRMVCATMLKTDISQSGQAWRNKSRQEGRWQGN